MQKKIDLVNGPVLSSLTRLAIPIMATSLIQMAYNMTDMIWIGRIGSSAVASVGAAGMYMWLSNGLAVLAKMGGQVNVGHALGADDKEKAAEYVSNALAAYTGFGDYIWNYLYIRGKAADSFLSFESGTGNPGCSVLSEDYLWSCLVFIFESDIYRVIYSNR